MTNEQKQVVRNVLKTLDDMLRQLEPVSKFTPPIFLLIKAIEVAIHIGEGLVK